MSQSPGYCRVYVGELSIDISLDILDDPYQAPQRSPDHMDLALPMMNQQVPILVDEGTSGFSPFNLPAHACFFEPVSHFPDNPPLVFPVFEPMPKQIERSVAPGFTHKQAPAAVAIVHHLRDNPEATIPSELITQELAEIFDDKGYCLIGNCGHTRAAQKTNPDYNPEDTHSAKNIDHLKRHIKDEHFNSSFKYFKPDTKHVREHFVCPGLLTDDLKYHLSSHTTLPNHTPAASFEQTLHAIKMAYARGEATEYQNRHNRETAKNLRGHGDPNLPCSCCHEAESFSCEESDYEDDLERSSFDFEDEEMEGASSNGSDNSGSEFGGN